MFKEHLPSIIASAVLIVALPITKAVLNHVITKFGDITFRKARVKQIKQIIAISTNIIAIILLAMIWSVDSSNIVGGLTAIFAVIGIAFFAQWSILSNVTAGIVMFFNAPYRAGDLIHIIDKDTPITATIQSIGSFYTYIHNEEGEQIVLPNNIFLQKTVLIKMSAEELDKILLKDEAAARHEAQNQSEWEVQDEAQATANRAKTEENNDDELPKREKESRQTPE